MKTKPSSMPFPLQNPAFPFEIVDLILKNVSYSLRPDESIIYHWDELRRCSLVCKAWVPICQALLFRSIELNQDCLSKPRRVERIVQLVKENLQIASYVKKIAYTVMPNDQGSVGNRSISSLLHLPNLHSLEIQGNIMRALTFDRCRTKNFGFFRFWDAYIPSTSLGHLSLTALNDPPLLEILSCPNLTSICLRDCAFSDWDPSFTTITVPSAPQIRSLSLEFVQNISYALLVFLPNLKELSLTHVEWYIPSKTPRDQFVIPFQGLQILRVDDTPFPLDGPTAWLPFLLSIADERGAKLFGNLKEVTASPDSLEEAEEVLHRILQHSPVLQDLDWTRKCSSSSRWLCM
ncbi:hypothetical protein BJ165DRAFT_180977 [Panaeolus papilionaceus]|nr:hypothetical protein BJ165DRAFT_180977 [Panaeolus papilionaceus]